MSRIRFEDTTPINKGNLDKLNNVVISPTEPTTGEEVWIQKGKNLVSKVIEGYTLDGNGGMVAYNGAFVTEFIEVQPNTSYISSGFINTYKEWYDENFSKISDTTVNPAVSPTNAKYLRMNGTGTYTNLQLEQGSVATSYEPYINKKIHTKNDNGVYEEFYEDNGIVESGSNENGNYIKYVDGTMICYGKKTFQVDINTTTGALYSGTIDNALTFPQKFVGLPGYVSVNSTHNEDYYFCFVQGVVHNSSGITTISLLKPIAVSTQIPLTYLAIGRWK